MKTKIYVFAIATMLAGFTSCQKLKEMKDAAFSKTLKEIIQEAEAATFIIYTYDEFGSPSGSGSGFFIDKTGVGITNYHVLDGAVKAVIKTSDEREYEIDKVMLSDKKWDIVEFTTKHENSDVFSYLTFSKKEIEKGDEVYNISSPMGLEKTVSEGIVSSLREDKQHGEVVQITAPISSGSSGSPIMDKNGDVIAVATFLKRGGQNLNFGVRINNAKLRTLTNTDFSKNNPKFNSKANFVILNIPSDRGSDIMLNAIEFGEAATTLYLSYTNLNLSSGEYYIWNELNKKDEGFLIEDLKTKQKYYLTSSTIGVDKQHGTKVPLASTVHFKVYFPAIKENLENIDVIYGYDTRGWQFTNIDLNKYRSIVNVNMEDYQKDYALATMREGELSDAQDILLEVIENNPGDIVALNTLGIISYVVDNNQDALHYFSQAIENSPNDNLAYINRHAVYKYQEKYDSALEDINKAINIDPAQPDNYAYRAYIYMNTEDWKNAKADLDKVIASEDFKKDADAYLIRVYANAHLGDLKSACKDIYTAFQLADDKETEEELQKLWDQCGCIKIKL